MLVSKILPYMYTVLFLLDISRKLLDFIGLVWLAVASWSYNCFFLLIKRIILQKKKKLQKEKCVNASLL